MDNEIHYGYVFGSDYNLTDGFSSGYDYDFSYDYFYDFGYDYFYGFGYDYAYGSGYRSGCG